MINGCKGSESGEHAEDFKPQSIINIEVVQPFRLEQSFKFGWARNTPDVQSGLLVVFKVNPELVVPKNALEPVLYAGNLTVQRLNQGDKSGFVLAIIPEQIDLTKEPVWFGSPALPERIGPKWIEEERSRAEKTGIEPVQATEIKSRTLEPVVVSDLSTLLRNEGAALLLKYSPQEKWLADSWRLPVTRK